MYQVIREIEFSYAHRLPEHAGKCKRLHGHNGKVWVEVSSDQLDEQGMVVDFYEIKKQIEGWIDETLDHRTILFEGDPLVKVLHGAGEKLIVMKEIPTAENLARLIFDEAKKRNLPVSKVTFWETSSSAAVYGAP